MVDPTNLIVYTHEEFRQGIQEIANQIDQSDFEPDVIVGIVRGGAIPAVYLSHKLRKPVIMVHWSTRDASEFGNESNAWLPEDIHGGLKVLIIDDIVDGGETIRELLEDWQLSTAGLGELPHDNVRIAAMWYNTSQDVSVHFYHKVIDRTEDQRWITYDWEC